MKRELRQQLMRRTVRNLPNLTPFMIGAAVGAVMNRRDTRKLAERVRADLRARQIPWDALPELPPLERPSARPLIAGPPSPAPAELGADRRYAAAPPPAAAGPASTGTRTASGPPGR